VFTAAAALLAALAATVVPAASVAATGRIVTQRAPVSMREQRRARDFLVVAQVVIAVALLAGTGLLVRSMLRLRAVDPGIGRFDVTVIDLHRRVDPAGVPVRGDGFFDEVLRRIRDAPGVESASYASSMPFRPRDYYGQGWRRRVVDAGYFAMLGIPLESGRAFDSRDRAGGEPVAILSRSLAARAFPGRDPIGARFDDDYTVVGVVADVRHVSLDEQPEPALYVPLAQQDESRLSLLLRSALPADVLANTVRGVVAGIDPDQPIGSVTTLRRLRDDSDAVSRRRFELRVLLAVGAFALLLAALGVYGVVAQTVVRRTPEIGVRVTLGASRADVVRLVIGGVGRLLLVGVSGGLLGSLALARLLRTALFGVGPADPLSLLAAPTLLAAAALLAAALPARRAASIDPARALREE
jgi:putative ABC transport system permease protein